MGCTHSSCASPGSLVAGAAAETAALMGMMPGHFVALCIHSQALFKVSADGACSKIEPRASFSKGRIGPLGLRISDTEIFTLGANSPKRLDMLTQEGASLACRSSWRLARGMVLPRKGSGAGDSVVVFHEQGLYSVSVTTGEWKRLGSSTWMLLTALAYDPEQDVAWALHDHGLFRVDLATGSFGKVGTTRWNAARGVVWTSRGLVVVHDAGVDRVSTATGAAERLSAEPWAQARSVVDAGDGTALIFHAQGLYKLQLGDGSYHQVPSVGGWNCLRGVWPLSLNTRAVSSPGSLLGSRDSQESLALMR